MNLSSYFKFIQFLLWQDIALCVSDSTFWKHHVKVDQTNKKVQSIINHTDERNYNSQSESDDKYIPIEIEPTRIKAKGMKEKPNIKTGEVLENSHQSTESETSSDFEDSYNTEEIQTAITLQRNLRAKSVINNSKERKQKDSTPKELTTALVSVVTHFKATTTHTPLTKHRKLKKAKTTPKYTNKSIGRIYGTTSKFELDRKGRSYPGFTLQNENDISFSSHKAKGRSLLSGLRSKKKHNVKKQFRSSTTNRTVKKKKQNIDSVANLEYFHPNIIAKQLNCLAKKWENKMRIIQEVIGRTSQYNDIVLWKLKEITSDRCKRAADNKFVDEEPEKKIILIVHGLSVMGWSKRTCFRDIAAFETLLSYYVDNLDAFDIFLIPMANPDGVLKVNELAVWNKNMSPQNACPGVNIDRNFDVAWRDSLNVTSCSQLYPGPHPFSEQESSAVNKILHKYAHKIIGYFHFHAGEYNANTLKGDAVLYPKGFTQEQDDDDRYEDLESEIDEAMKNMTFKVLSVSVDTLYDWYGKISGSSVDYASSSYGVPYSLELVLQLYNTYEQQDAALTEVWQNILDVIFDHIAKSQTKDNDNDQ